MDVRISKDLIKFFIELINQIIDELTELGILSPSAKKMKYKVKAKKRKSYSIHTETMDDDDMVILHIDGAFIKDFSNILHSFILKCAPIFLGVKNIISVFTKKDDDILKEFNQIKDTWKDRYRYGIFTYDNQFFDGTKFIGKTLDNYDWEIVDIDFGTPKEKFDVSNNIVVRSIKTSAVTNIKRWLKNYLATPIFSSMDLKIVENEFNKGGMRDD